MSKQRRVRTGKDLQQYAIPINHKPMTFKRYVLLKYPELTHRVWQKQPTNMELIFKQEEKFLTSLMQ